MTRIRPAALSDAEQIAHVHVETWRDAYAGILPTDMLVRMSEKRQIGYWRAALVRRRVRETILVAERGREIVGFGTAGKARAAKGATGEVHMLYVSPDHREGGIGRSLLRELFASMRRHRMTGALIWVVAENPSRFFYEAMGGQPALRREERLWGTMVRTLAYRWDDLDKAIATLDGRSPVRRRTA